LEPGQPDGVALIPYKGKVQPIVQYRGLIKLATESQSVERVDAYVVYENDKFDYRIEQGEEKLTHVPTPLNQKRGEAIGAYAVFFLPGQAKPKFEVMPLEDLEKVKKSSPAASSGPWVSWPDEMRKKTAIRRGFKTIPTSPKVRDTIEADTKMEMGVGVEDIMDLTLVEGGDSPEPQSQSAAIASDLAAKLGGEGTALPPPPSSVTSAPTIAAVPPDKEEGATLPGLMDLLHKNPGVMPKLPYPIRSTRPNAPDLGRVMGLSWQGTEAHLTIEFASNLGEIAQGLTPQMVITTFAEAGIKVQEAPQPSAPAQGSPEQHILTPPPAPSKKPPPAQAAELKKAVNQLADLQAAYNVPWETITKEHGIRSWEEIKTLEHAQLIKATLMKFNPER